MARMPDGWVVTVEADRSDVRLKESRELVMCKSCKHAHMTYSGECKYCDIITMLDEEGDPTAMYLPGDWYCAAGERRGGEG